MNITDSRECAGSSAHGAITALSDTHAKDPNAAAPMTTTCQPAASSLVAGPEGVAPPSSDQSWPSVSSFAGSDTTSGARSWPRATTGVVTTSLSSLISSMFPISAGAIVTSRAGGLRGTVSDPDSYDRSCGALTPSRSSVEPPHTCGHGPVRIWSPGITGYVVILLLISRSRRDSTASMHS